MTICDLEIGQSAVISAVGGEGALRQHFLDMGLIPGIEVTLIKYAPMGDPMELMVSGYSLTLRLADAARIDITNVHEHPGGRGEVPEPSQRLDRFLTGKWTAIPAFVAIMGLVFWLTAMNVATPIHSLIIDGVFTGVGSVWKHSSVKTKNTHRQRPVSFR